MAVFQVKFTDGGKPTQVQVTAPSAEVAADMVGDVTILHVTPVYAAQPQQSGTHWYGRRGAGKMPVCVAR